MVALSVNINNQHCAQELTPLPLSGGIFSTDFRLCHHETPWFAQDDSTCRLTVYAFILITDMTQLVSGRDA